MEDLEQINAILDEFRSNTLYSLELRRDLFVKEPPTFDVTQDSTDDGDPPENISQMAVDGTLLSRLDYDLASYETYLSAVQFNWIEAAAKEKFISTTLMTDDALGSSDAELKGLGQSLEVTNLEFENALRNLERDIKDEETQILRMAQELEDRYTVTQSTYKLARALTNDVADLELELNELKLNQKEDDSELMTIEEAAEAAGELERQLMDMTNRLASNNEDIPKLKAQYAKESKLVEQLRIERNTLQKAEGERRRTLSSRVRGSAMAQLESGRTWYSTTSQTYRAALGIMSIGVSGPDPSKPTRLQIKFALRPPLTGTLVIKFNNSDLLCARKISAAYLDQSSQDITQIVEPYVENGDITALIHTVQHFLARLQSTP